MTISEANRHLLGPKTCAYLDAPHDDYTQRALYRLAALVLAERTNSVGLPEGWQAFALVVLLGDVLDYWKAGKITTERAEQYQKEAKQAILPSKLLRLLVVLHHETNPILTP